MTVDPATVNVQAARLKYVEERNKRVRKEGPDQYQDDVRELDKDPFCIPVKRKALTGDEMEVVIVGAGFGGLSMAIELSKVGFDNVRIVEKAGDVGGTWYWNRYPGLMCDVESTIYLPYLEDVGYLPKHKYASGSDILEFSRRLAKTYNLYDKILFQTEVQAAVWNEVEKRWLITTNQGDSLKAKFLAMATGFLHKPKLPKISGIEKFNGRIFHTSRWDFDYTGGDCYGGMSRLHDKNVGIVGTGTTAIQAVPKLAEAAKHLYVFQRTPCSVSPRNNGLLDVEYFKSAPKGWHLERRDNFGKITSGMVQERPLVHDGWVELFQPSEELLQANQKDSAQNPTMEDLAAAAELDDILKMEKMRRRVDEIVKDPATAEKLKPWYGLWCKRPGFHDEYLPTFNRDNVTLVDTQGKGVDSIVPDGVVVQEKTYPLDCIIFATGFEFSTDLEHRTRTKIVGRNGLDLMEHWKDGPRTLHGLMTTNFPNMFYVSNVQAGVGPNYAQLLVEQAKHMSYIIAQTEKRGASTVGPTVESEENWIREITESPTSKGRARYLLNCTPGYLNNESQVDEKYIRTFSYPTGAVPFYNLIKAWRDEGSCKGLIFDATS